MRRIGFIGTTATALAFAVLEGPGMMRSGASTHHTVSAPDDSFDTDAPSNTHEEIVETPNQIEPASTHEEVIAVSMSPENIQKRKEEALLQWKIAQTSLVFSSLKKALQNMDTALAQTPYTRDEIGATSDAVKECCLRFAKSEWERAEYFRGIGFRQFQRGALKEMYAGLTEASADIEEIGVTADMVEAMQAELRAD